MADLAVTVVKDKLIPLLMEEAALLQGIHEEVEDIKDELETIHAFIKDANSKADKEAVDQVWVKQVKEAAYRIEDVIDEYVLHVAQHPDQHGFTAFLHRIAYLVKNLIARHQIASKIRGIKASLQKNKVRNATYKDPSSGKGASSSSNRGKILDGSLLTEEAELFGIETPREALISHLISETDERIVISVFGMDGLGKTTLARTVYDDHRVKKKFQTHAWITASQLRVDEKELLKTVLKKFYEARKEPLPESIAAMDELPLREQLKEYLGDECYLVVFDDVWETSFWKTVELGLSNNNKGSRILITTTKKEVVDTCRASSLDHVHNMDPLPQGKAWDLFCNRAFKFEVEKRCPKELEKLSQDIVEKCERLPLAIVAIGGLLATKEKSAEEWGKFLKRLDFALVSDPQLERVRTILALSYSDLPQEWKPCFIYLSMFPKYFPIKRRRLIQLWIANGFVQNKERMTLEEVGLECLTGLIHRSLVQVHEVSHAGNPVRYRVHDLVRDFILSKSQELSVSHVSMSCSTIKGIARHISISDKESDHPLTSSNTKSETRSIILFNKEPPVRVIGAIFSKCKLLTTLDFENCPIDHIPKQLGKLLHLRFLSFKNTNVSKLPKSIKKLHNLETLDLRRSLVDELQVEINNFPKLRNLLGGHRETYVLKIHGNINKLGSLQTLWRMRVDDDHDGARLIDELGTLTQLGKLGITKLRSGHGGKLCTALQKMTGLRSLLVSSDEVLGVQSISSPPQLKVLRFIGKLESFPDWICKINNLTKLELSFSRLGQGSIKGIHALLNLKYLSLLRAYDGETMHFENCGFQQLIRLDLEGLDELKGMTIDDGALPILEFLKVGLCPKLEEVPSGIQHLKKLKELSFAGMTAEFTQKLSGGDKWKVENVPVVEYDGTYDPKDQTSYAAHVQRWYGWITKPNP